MGGGQSFPLHPSLPEPNIYLYQMKYIFTYIHSSPFLLVGSNSTTDISKPIIPSQSTLPPGKPESLQHNFLQAASSSLNCSGSIENSWTFKPMWEMNDVGRVRFQGKGEKTDI